MPHNPEHSSEHGHSKIISPDDDGFDWPLVERPYRSHDSMTHASTHRYPDGHYYTIQQGPDDDIGSVGVRLFDESHTKDPIKYGLYSTSEQGAPIRPDASSLDFIRSTGNLPNSEYKNTEALDVGALAVDSEGSISRTNNEKRDIDARATPIIASYEARDRALAEGKSIEEAQAIGAEVYNVHFGMKGEPIESNLNNRPALGSFENWHRTYDLPSGSTSAEQEDYTPPRSRQRKFGKAASGSAFRQEAPRSTADDEQTKQMQEFVRVMQRRFPRSSAWLKDIDPKNPQDLQNIQDLVNDIVSTRAEMIKNDITDKRTQDSRIFRGYRMNLETSDNPDEKIKRDYGLLWDLMGENPKGEIPF
jgi:hypothetical protein